MKSFSKREADRRTFLEQVRESKENGYLLSSKKIGSGAFSKVYLGYATQEKMMQNYKLASDLRNKRHSMVSPGRGKRGSSREREGLARMRLPSCLCPTAISPDITRFLSIVDGGRFDLELVMKYFNIMEREE